MTIVRSQVALQLLTVSMYWGEDKNFTKTIKEATYIWVNGPIFNENICKNHLSHIWNEILFNNPQLKLK